jgi:hypothetical protein
MPSLDSIITFSTLAALVQFGIIISVILRVMLTRHPPGSAFAWILITTLLPYFGFILYLLFGERPIGQLRATRFRKHLAHLKELSRQKLTPTGPLPRHLARHRTLIHLATRMGNLPVTSGTEIRLLSSSDDTFAAIISDIEAACSSIDMEFYIWHPGGDLKPVAIETDVHPGFMTDWQQPLVVALTQAKGLSIVHETVYENRFGFTKPLVQMGATIQLYRECLGSLPCRFQQRNYKHSAVIFGPTPLTGRDIDVPDLRGGFSHLIAALAAKGPSNVQGISLIDRGYADFRGKLEALGADFD